MTICADCQKDIDEEKKRKEFYKGKKTWWCRFGMHTYRKNTCIHDPNHGICVKCGHDYRDDYDGY